MSERQGGGEGGGDESSRLGGSRIARPAAACRADALTTACCSPLPPPQTTLSPHRSLILETDPSVVATRVTMRQDGDGSPLSMEASGGAVRRATCYVCLPCRMPSCRCALPPPARCRASHGSLIPASGLLRPCCRTTPGWPRSRKHSAASRSRSLGRYSSRQQHRLAAAPFGSFQQRVVLAANRQSPWRPSPALRFTHQQRPRQRLQGQCARPCRRWPC